MKKVSVIMPNYNHAPFLTRRLNSILAQDYPNMEIILLDDASTDNSATILNEYAQHPKVKTLIINDINSGNPFIQWQHGLELATGEYVWIAESDDEAKPNLVSTLVAALERENAVLAFCRSERIDDAGKSLFQHINTRWNRDFSAEGKDFVRHYLLGFNTICNASAVVFRRDAAQTIDMQQIAQFPASGDRLFWILLAMQGRVTYAAETLNRFRQHTQKVSNKAEQKGLNIIQDHDIYRTIAPRLDLTRHEQRLICGYHWQAMHKSAVSKEGRLKAMKAWKHEPEFGRKAYWLYLLHQAKERC